MAKRAPRLPAFSRAPVTVKMRVDLRQQIETAAASNHRTISNEIEHRLIASFAQADLYATVRAALADERREAQAVDQAFAAALPSPAAYSEPLKRDAVAEFRAAIRRCYVPPANGYLPS